MLGGLTTQAEKARNDRNYKSKELRELSQQRIEKARNDRDSKSKESHETEVRISSLKDFIHEDRSSESVDEWLKNSSIENKQPVIDQLNIKDGWDTAFGYFLVEHLDRYHQFLMYSEKMIFFLPHEQYNFFLIGI